MKKNLPLIIIIIVVVVLVGIAIFLGEVSPIKRANEKGGEETTIPESTEIAEEIYGFSAEIKGIKDKTLTLEGGIPLADESAEPIKGTVKAVVTENTKIVKLKFPQEIPADTDEPVFPEETEMSFEDLKVGDEINIGTIENVSEKIKNGQEFQLSDIFIIIVE